VVIDIDYHLHMSDTQRKPHKAAHPRGSYDHAGPHLFQEIVRTHQVLIGVFSLEVGMSSARMGVLRQLDDCEDGSMGVVDLARSLGVTPAIVTRQVQDLEAEGLLRRRNDSRDRRRSQLHLTARGRRAFARLHERAHGLQERVLDGLKDEEIAAACRVLRSLRTAIETQRNNFKN
jgi:MarR family transcriptional regulator for hemolysin